MLPIGLAGINSTIGSYDWQIPTTFYNYPEFALELELDSDSSIFQYSTYFYITGLAATSSNTVSQLSTSSSSSSFQYGKRPAAKRGAGDTVRGKAELGPGQPRTRPGPAELDGTARAEDGDTSTGVIEMADSAGQQRAGLEAKAGKVPICFSSAIRSR